MPKVRTRMQPDVEIEVPEDEYEVLKASGLLADEPQTDDSKTRTAVQPPAAPSTANSAPDPAADTTTKKG